MCVCKLSFSLKFICIKVFFCSLFVWFLNEKEEVLSGSDFYLGVSLKKFLIFYSYGEGKIFFFFRFKEF